MVNLVVQFVLGLFYTNVGEWLVHRYILHGFGKKRNSFWAYHLYEHHVVCRTNGMIDLGYQKLNLKKWNAQTKELAVLACIVLIHLPIFFIYPIFICAVYLSFSLYYYKHRKAHIDPEWAKRHLRWHYEHHLAVNSRGNWCVSWPWFDYLMGTRVKSSMLD
jgi:sterol desaturase/sphingolipid hydroxylase (fatty acid hydroxylase superfamily)